MPKNIPQELKVLKNKINQEDSWLTLLDVTLNDDDSTVIRLARSTEDVYISSSEVDELVGHWKMNDTSGTDVVDSAGSNTGTWLGTELVTNGDFADWSGSGFETTPDGWETLYIGTDPDSGDNFSDAGNACLWTVSQSIRLQQDILVFGKTYSYSFTIQNYSTGSIILKAGGASGDTLADENSDGTYTGTFTHTADVPITAIDRFMFFATGTSSFELADVSVRELVDSVPGVINTALLFDGVDDKITIPADSSIDAFGKTELSICAWINPSSQGEGTGRIVDKRAATLNGYRLYVNQEVGGMVGIQFSIRTESNTVIAEVAQVIPINTWSHIVAVYNEDGAQKGKVYINSVLQTLELDTAGIDTISDDSGNVLTIGNIAGNDRAFDGSIDDVRIYDKALSIEEIANIYNDGNGTELALPIKYTAFNFGLDMNKITNTGEIPTLKLKVSNVDRFLTSYLEDLDGMVGATVKITIINESELSLDYTELEQDWDVVETSVNEQFVEFTLSRPNLLRIRYPINKFLANHCNHKYKEAECAYVGALETCERNFKDCILHDNTARFGGFLGLGDSAGVRVV